MIMPFGKHKGRHIYDVPTDYLQWMWDKMELRPAMAEVVSMELERRICAARSRVSVAAARAEPVADRWYRKAALEFHPDAGGTTRDMQVVNRLRDILNEMLEEAK